VCTHADTDTQTETHRYVRILILTNAYTYTPTNLPTHLPTCPHTYMHAYRDTDTVADSARERHRYTDTCAPTLIHLCVHTYTHMHTCIEYVHTHVPTSLPTHLPTYSRTCQTAYLSCVHTKHFVILETEVGWSMKFRPLVIWVAQCGEVLCSGGGGRAKARGEAPPINRGQSGDPWCWISPPAMSRHFSVLLIHVPFIYSTKASCCPSYCIRI
jgi:hypothetical protein